MSEKLTVMKATMVALVGLLTGLWGSKGIHH